MSWLQSFWKALRTPAPASPETLPGGTPDNLTPRAQQVLELACGEARRFNHNFVGTEHVLLGLIRFGRGAAIDALKKQGIALDIVASEIEKQIGRGPDPLPLLGSSTPRISYTPRVKKALRLAAREAAALKHNYVGTDHILLGLLREGDGVAARVLKNLNVDLETMRTEIFGIIGPNAPEADLADDFLKPTKPESTPVDVSQRYDVHCLEGSQVAVYRNALFRGSRSLLKTESFDTFAFLELELTDGQVVFVSRFSVIKFCKPGANPDGEMVAPGKP